MPTLRFQHVNGSSDAETSGTETDHTPRARWQPTFRAGSSAEHEHHYSSSSSDTIVQSELVSTSVASRIRVATPKHRRQQSDSSITHDVHLRQPLGSAPVDGEEELEEMRAELSKKELERALLTGRSGVQGRHRAYTTFSSHALQRPDLNAGSTSGSDCENVQTTRRRSKTLSEAVAARRRSRGSSVSNGSSQPPVVQPKRTSQGRATKRNSASSPKSPCSPEFASRQNWKHLSGASKRSSQASVDKARSRASSVSKSPTIDGQDYVCFIDNMYGLCPSSSSQTSFDSVDHPSLSWIDSFSADSDRSSECSESSPAERRTGLAMTGVDWLDEELACPSSDEESGADSCFDSEAGDRSRFGRDRSCSSTRKTSEEEGQATPDLDSCLEALSCEFPQPPAGVSGELAKIAVAGDNAPSSVEHLALQQARIGAFGDAQRKGHGKRVSKNFRIDPSARSRNGTLAPPKSPARLSSLPLPPLPHEVQVSPNTASGDFAITRPDSMGLFNNGSSSSLDLLTNMISSASMPRRQASLLRKVRPSTAESAVSSASAASASTASSNASSLLCIPGDEYSEGDNSTRPSSPESAAPPRPARSARRQSAIQAKSMQRLGSDDGLKIAMARSVSDDPRNLVRSNSLAGVRRAASPLDRPPLTPTRMASLENCVAAAPSDLQQREEFPQRLLGAWMESEGESDDVQLSPLSRKRQQERRHPYAATSRQAMQSLPDVVAIPPSPESGDAPTPPPKSPNRATASTAIPPYPHPQILNRSQSRSSSDLLAVASREREPSTSRTMSIRNRLASNLARAGRTASVVLNGPQRPANERVASNEIFGAYVNGSGEQNNSSLSLAASRSRDDPSYLHVRASASTLSVPGSALGSNSPGGSFWRKGKQQRPVPEVAGLSFLSPDASESEEEEGPVWVKGAAARMRGSVINLGWRARKGSGPSPAPTTPVAQPRAKAGTWRA